METITSYMEQDHDRIDGHAARATAAAGAQDWSTLQDQGSEFLRRLQRHIEIEEDLLFPAFEQRTGMVAAGPSRQMRDEHEWMQPILVRMQQALAANDGAEWQRATRSLLDILEPHNVKEEQMMYPMLEDAAGAEAQELLLQVRQRAL
jgi:iron-sulfur cluster repair protein YtfE (RIC family)